MSTVIPDAPCRAILAAVQAVLFAFAMSSGTPIEGANIRPASRSSAAGTECT